MEEIHNIVCIKNINRNSADADIVKNKILKHINKSLSIPIHKINTTNINNQNTPAVKNFGQSAKALGMPSKQPVTNGKVAQLAKSTSIPVLSNADSGATGNYIRLADINVLRDVRVSTPAEQIAVAVADGNLLQ